jgi:anti-anti-sigma regulatory factor
MSAARPIRIDLDGVTFIDAGGTALLRAMHADGALLAATTLMMRALADEIVTVQDSVRDGNPIRPPQR